MDDYPWNPWSVSRMCGGKSQEKVSPQVSEGIISTVDKRHYFLYLSTLVDTYTKKKSQWMWRLMVKQLSQLKFTNFYESKKAMVEPMIQRKHQLKELGVCPHYLCLDNAGEKVSLQKCDESTDWKLGLQYELTARDTPQQNVLAKIGFTVIVSRAKAILNYANMPIAK
jgi:hypothetical protein